MVFETVTPMDVIARLQDEATNTPHEQALLNAARFMLNVQMSQIYSDRTVMPLDRFVLSNQQLDGGTVWTDPENSQSVTVYGVTVDLWRWN